MSTENTPEEPIAKGEFDLAQLEVRFEKKPFDRGMIWRHRYKSKSVHIVGKIHDVIHFRQFGTDMPLEQMALRPFLRRYTLDLDLYMSLKTITALQEFEEQDMYECQLEYVVSPINKLIYWGYNLARRVGLVN